MMAFLGLSGMQQITRITGPLHQEQQTIFLYTCADIHTASCMVDKQIPASFQLNSGTKLNRTLSR